VKTPRCLPFPLVLLWSCLLASGTAAQPARPPATAVAADDLTVYVMTFAPGDEPWEKFGHIALCVRERGGADVAYNWGMFDFAADNFVANFIQGRMTYWMEGFDAGAMADLYVREGRSVWVQVLNLTPDEERRLAADLARNASPENKYYRYDYYHDNCSTRVRDAIDRATNGAVAAALKDEPTHPSFRYHTRRLSKGSVWLYTFLQTVMGRSIDRPTTLWEECFLPEKVKKFLPRVTVTGPDGRAASLVASEGPYGSIPWPKEDLPPSRYWIAYAAGGVLFAAVVIACAAWWSPVARAGFTLATIGWALTFGLIGVIGTWGWIGTDHTVARHNVSLLMASPLLFALVVVGPLVAWSRKGRGRKALAVIAYGTAATTVLGAILNYVPSLHQVIPEVIAVLVPANLGLALATYLILKRREPSPLEPGV